MMCYTYLGNVSVVHRWARPENKTGRLLKDAGTGGQLPLQLKMRRDTAPPPNLNRGSTYIFEWLYSICA